MESPVSEAKPGAPGEAGGGLLKTKCNSSPMVRKVRGLIVIYGDLIPLMDDARELQIQRSFGDRVRELRKQRQLSQETLALACDLDRTYIGGVERGERNISIVNIYKIAEALGVEARELFNA